MIENRHPVIEHDVVVAGAGPTGLMLAGELAVAGADVLVIERRSQHDLVGSLRRSWSTKP
jgi:2-polyprenyl-6-methoxyphenol hydroxylase-like FAD-dependent oxidoreductase